MKVKRGVETSFHCKNLNKVAAGDRLEVSNLPLATFDVISSKYHNVKRAFLRSTNIGREQVPPTNLLSGYVSGLNVEHTAGFISAM